MSRLYGLSGFLSLLGFVGLYTDQKWFLFLFFAVFDFKYFFKKPDEMQIMQMQKAAANGFYAAIPLFSITLIITFFVLNYDFDKAFAFSAGILIAVLFFVQSISGIVFNVKELKDSTDAQD